MPPGPLLSERRRAELALARAAAERRGKVGLRRYQLGFTDHDQFSWIAVLDAYDAADAIIQIEVRGAKVHSIKPAPYATHLGTRSGGSTD